MLRRCMPKIPCNLTLDACVNYGMLCALLSTSKVLRISRVHSIVREEPSIIRPQFTIVHHSREIKVFRGARPSSGSKNVRQSNDAS
jgi:hypothetical protein